jgi:hypothetical protein
MGGGAAGDMTEGSLSLPSVLLLPSDILPVLLILEASESLTQGLVEPLAADEAVLGLPGP